jgi:hypothetical protein
MLLTEWKDISFALPKLQDIILKASFLIHYEEICFLGNLRVNLKEKLIIDECFNWVFKVIASEICVCEGEIEHFIPEEVVCCLFPMGIYK